jgi:predicted DNA-binding ribbon-helix-helix protein
MRSVEIAGHKTSVSLEPLFWDLLKQAAREEDVPLNALVARIDAERLDAPTPPGLAGAIRLWLAAREFRINSSPHGGGGGAER